MANSALPNLIFDNFSLASQVVLITGASAAVFSKALDWNVTPAFNLSKQAYELMLKNSGCSIINISSKAGQLRQKI